MNCEKCSYYGGFVKDDSTYSGLRMICNAPKQHLAKNYWSRADGATLPGHHCGWQRAHHSGAPLAPA